MFVSPNNLLNSRVVGDLERHDAHVKLVWLSSNEKKLLNRVYWDNQKL